jgi:large subunit ribosomal protein L18e
MHQGKTNTELQDTIRFLKVKARENKSRIWTVAAEHLSRPRRRRTTLDLNHISRSSVADSAVLVPGKVLGDGLIKHPVTVGAFDFSHGARVKIERAGGKCFSIQDFVSKYPKGSKVLILR